MESSSNGLSVNYQYDKYGQLLSTTDQSGRQTQFEYTSDGLLATVIQATGQAIVMGYDGRGRQISLSRAGIGTRTVRYDILGQVESKRGQDSFILLSIMLNEAQKRVLTPLSLPESPAVAETLTLPELFDAVNGIGGKFRNDGNAVVVDALQEALTVAIATALAEHQQCLISLYPAPRVVNSDVLAVNSSELLTDEEFERELMGM